MNPPIPYTKMNSLPVTIAEDDLPLPVTLSGTISDPLNVTLDSSQVPLLVTSEGAVFNNSVSTADTLFNLDMDQYESAFIHITSAGSGCTTSYTTSNDGVNYVNVAGLAAQNIGASTAATSTTTALGLRFPKAGRYLKAAVTTYGSGTVSATAYLAKSPAPVIPSVATVTASSTTGAAAHGAAISGNPVRIGGRAVTTYSALAAGQTADIPCTLAGAVIQKPFALPASDWAYAAAASGIVNTTTAVSIKAAAAAGLKNYITSISFMSESLGAATELAIRDGAGGAVLWRTKIPITTLIPMTYVNFPSPLSGTAATLLEVVTLTASVTGAVYFNATGFIAP